MNNNNKNAIYISGKMSGMPEYNYDGFKKAEIKLKRQFPESVIINPMDVILKIYSMDDLLNNNYDYQFVLDTVIKVLKEDCKAIYMLKGWENSNGARAELRTAISLHYLIYFEQ